MNAIDYIDLALLASLTAAVLYLCFLAFFGIIGRKKERGVLGDYRFLILIPAHNEETAIAKTLESLKCLEQGANAEIVAVADNCDDRTAEVARAGGVRVLERNDPQNRGKGFALEWAIERHNLDDYDAVVVVDADTLVEENML
ncbi:MAG: glycosyltransferase [Candidatus Zixiibacteriota bacterium]|nr:MAG: glycosyltransferase [candidate division Zixibacteria bacterium]